MNVLLLGNGFDLHYRFPTKYINFLNTVDFIKNNTLVEIKSVGDILGVPKLHEIDREIAESYNTHKELYHATPLSMDLVAQLGKMAESNMWYSYLIKSYNKDIGWIDFEDQINSVIIAFKDFLVQPTRVFSFNEYPGKHLSRYILKQFDFFLKKESGNTYSIREEYMIEDPKGSKLYQMNDEKWIGRIKKELDELTEMLRLYLYHFVELPMINISREKMRKEWFVQLNPDYVITFNYTSTFEHFSDSGKIVHIHGKLDEGIVLGVNPNEDDEVDSADTTFIEFKKYLQRIVLGTDDEYRAIADEMDDSSYDLALTVMGHSLDVTDKDIIYELFGYASEIAILYRSSKSLRKYVAKLIQLYGKDEFDSLRKEKKLRFVSIDKELATYVAEKTRDKYSFVDLGLDSYSIV